MDSERRHVFIVYPHDLHEPLKPPQAHSVGLTLTLQRSLLVDTTLYHSKL